MYSGYTAHRDIVYGNGGGMDLTLDLFVPNNALRAVPVIVYIHGGGWSGLDKSWCPYPMRLIDQEYAVASINYRLLDQGGAFPNHLHDCKAAIRWVRAHAAEYGLDGSRIGVWGDSAGGHLAAMVGLTGDRPELEGNSGTPGVSSRVQGVCCYFPATDFLYMVGPDPDSCPGAEFFGRLIGIDVAGGDRLSEHLDKLAAASPVTYASPDAPPMLLLHGDVDVIVSVVQSVLLYEKLWQAGADVRLHIVHGGDHLDYRRDPADIPWNTPEIRQLEDAFFYRTLKGHERPRE